MNSSLFLELEGLAMCYFNHDGWNVEFVCDTNHKIYFYQKGLVGNLSIDLSEFKELLVSHSHIVKLPAINPGSTNFFDMSSNYAHPHGIKRKTHPKLETVPMLSLGACELSDSGVRRMYMVDQNAADANGVVQLLNTEPIGYVGSSVTLSYEFSPGGSFELYGVSKIDSLKKLIFSQKFNVPGHRTIVLDNDCSACNKLQSDFHLYYEVYEDAHDPTYHVSVDRVDNIASAKVRGRTNCYAVVSRNPI